MAGPIIPRVIRGRLYFQSAEALIRSIGTATQLRRCADGGAV
jgi:hypothetical protein